MNKDETQIILILDMASDNPIPQAELDRLIPSSTQRHVFRLSDFGVSATARGATVRQRRAWMIAVNQMLAAARKRANESALPVHYYVTGHAFLPIFAHVGLGLSKWSRITCINCRKNGQWDVMPFHGAIPESPQESYFNVVEGLDECPDRKSSLRRRGKVAVFVSTGLECPDNTIMDFMRAHESELAGIVRIQAMNPSSRTPTKHLDADNAAQAASELCDLFVSIYNAYPEHEGLVLFVAGPVQLALIAGRAINPNLHAPVWIPNYEEHVYRPAVEWPWGHGRKLKTFIVTANPVNQDRLDIRAELQTVRDEIDRSGSGRAFELRECHDARLEDIRRAMLEMRPQILHFSGHSDPGTLALVGDKGKAQLVSAQALVDLLEATNDSFLDLIVFNSCDSDKHARAVSSFVDCAIGMSDEIADDVARVFARTFYGALARGRTVKNAFDQAVAMLAGQGVPRSLVCLYTRDGLDADQIALVDPGRSSTR